MDIKKFEAQGVVITDELVRCDEQVTINATTYYRGFLANTANHNIQGNTSANYFVYDAVSEGGNRKEVIVTGYPADSTGTGDVSIDLKNGIMYSTVVDDYYVTYLAHEPIKHNINNLHVETGWLIDGAAITVAQIAFPFFAKVGFVSIDVQGSLPSADATLVLSNGTESVNVLLSSSTASYVVELDDPLKITTSEALSISTADGKDANQVLINLLDI